MAASSSESSGHAALESPSKISQVKATETSSGVERDGKAAQVAHENFNGNGTTHLQEKIPSESSPSDLRNDTTLATTTGNTGPGSADEGAQAPTPDPKPSAVPARVEASEATASTVAASEQKDKLGVHDKDEKPEDKNSQSSTTLAGTHNASQTRSTPRKTHKPSNSDGAASSSSQTNDKPKVPPSSRSSKPSFLSKLVSKLVPCIGPSTRAHAIEIDEPVLKPKEDAGVVPAEKEKALAKEPSADTHTAGETLPDPSKESPPELPTTGEASKQMAHTIPPALVVVPPLPLEGDVLLPPTPTKQLLPLSETEGVTSGAVQPPGSSGEGVVVINMNDQDDSRRHSREHDSRATGDGDGDESDGTSFTEDEQMEVEEDDEDRLIMSGGAGIPMGPDGIPRPLLPPISPQHAGRKCLVLDLDETLVHSSFKSISQADYVVPVEIEYHWHNVYVIKRPGVDNFLKKMGEIYEVVVFTASLSKYADPVLDKLDIHQVVSHRLFRESCYNHKGNYVKDLSQLGRPIQDTIILDNSPASYIFHPNNAVPVSSWFNDPHDTELTDLVPFLTDLAAVDDVRGILDGGV